MEIKKELHYCEGCKKENWFAIDKIYQRGSICPNGCQRNQLIFLGETEEEIVKRKREFIEKKGFEFEIDPRMEEDDKFENTSRKTIFIPKNPYDGTRWGF